MAKRGPPRHPDILTPREWEVLALLRQGLTNEGIAARLGISLAGAKYHVSEILGKLGVGSREEAAAWQPEEPRPWWAVAGAPLLFWRKLSLGWLSPVAAGAVVVVVAAGLGLLVWGLVRTQGEAAATPEPPEELVWENEDGSFRMVSVEPGTCGDAATADSYGVPMMLRVEGWSRTGDPVLLGLQAEPYEYVPGQVPVFKGSIYSPLKSPVGWELSMPVRKGPPIGIIDLYLRRLDRPSLLFGYFTLLCNQEDGSPAEPPEPPEPLQDLTLELPPELPLIVRHREGDYMSAQEAIDIAMEQSGRGRPGVRAVSATLGTQWDIFAARGVESTGPGADQVVWSVVLAPGNPAAPNRPGHEWGEFVFLDAATGDFVWGGCCLDLVFSP